MNRRRLLCLGLLCLSHIVALADLAKVKLIRVSPVTKRLVVEVDQAFHYRSFTLEDPKRLVIDILGAELDQTFRMPLFDKSPIKSLRTGLRHQRDLRLVFDLKTSIHVRDFSLIAPNQKKHSRLVVDWSEGPLKTLSSASQLNVNPRSKPHLSLPPEENVPKKFANPKITQHLRDMVIVIDPGHGGKDPGAIGSRGVREKTVVLAISKLIKENLEKYYGVQVRLTRQGDYYVSLRDRLAFARRGEADLFVSIHADAYHEGRSSGVSVYALSQSGASSEVAHWISDRENYSELGGVDLNDLQDSSDTLRTMLLDLSQTATIASSIRLGRFLLKQLNKVVDLHKSRVEQAPFVVLKSPDIPSLLVETGFISNLREERELASYLHQSKLAKAISEGIFNYAVRYARQDTFFAARYRKNQIQLVARTGFSHQGNF